MKKNRLIILAIILAGAIYIGYSIIFNSTKRDLNDEKVDFNLKANLLINEFEQDENLANKKYISKVVEVKGKIGEIIKNNDSSIVVIIKENDDMFGINCKALNNNIKINNYIVGDSISIRGIVQGYLNDVIINNCIITK